MLEFLAPFAVIFSATLLLPAFITAFQLLKEINIPSIRNSSYFKYFLAQVFLHSLFLIAALYHPSYEISFLMHSFCMIPLYALLLFRLYYIKNKSKQLQRVHKSIAEDRKNKAISERFRNKRLRLRSMRKSKWH